MMYKMQLTLVTRSLVPHEIYSHGRQDTVSYKKQEGFPQIKNSVVGIPAI